MTTLKRICIPRGKMVASLVIIAGMLTACGGGKRRNNFAGFNPQGLDFSSLSQQQGAFTLNQLGNLSQISTQNSSTQGNIGQYFTSNSSSGAPTNSNSGVTGVASSGQLTLAAGQDFGYLNSCYQQTLNQGQGFFRQNYTAESIFSGAGQEIVACYQKVLEQRTQWAQQQYQQQLYQWQYQQRLQQAYQQYFNLNNQQIFEPVRPPGLR